MLLIALAIRMESPGPVLYRQRRIGLNRVTFDLVKFRSMRMGTESMRENAGREDDLRITRVGGGIRKYRLDELPQLRNVLRGDMCLVRPRALMEEDVEEFERKISYFSLRHFVRPGISGWAQINYPHGTTVEDALAKLEYDLYYMKNASISMDLYILLRTMRTVLLAKGGEVMAGDMVRSWSESAVVTPLPGGAVTGIGGQQPRTKGSNTFVNRSVKVCGKAGGKR